LQEQGDTQSLGSTALNGPTVPAPDNSGAQYWQNDNWKGKTDIYFRFM